MQLPDFLIIGAMKAGTTTLYHDLLTNPCVFFPPDKEPGNLTVDDVLTEAGRRRYASMFKAARSNQICGEASTTYTKLPDLPDVSERAWKVLGPRLRVIYLVREPVSRIVSHHYHEYSEGTMGADINQAVLQFDRLINYSRYAMQIEPWLNRLGSAHVRIIRFESYVEERRSTVAALCRFLGIAPRPGLVEANQVFNPSEAKPAATGLLWRMSKSPWYRKTIRSLLPRRLKGRLQGQRGPPRRRR